MVKNNIRASVVGGDGRYRWAAEELKKNGCVVRSFGVPGLDDTERSLVETITGADLVLLPMLPLADGKLTVAGESLEAVMLPELLERGAVLAAGQLPPKLEAWLTEQGIACCEVLEREKFQLQNAYVTAEGAVGLLMREMNRTIRRSRILVTGWGRIGSFLAELLRDLGAEVTIGVRREAQKDFLQVLGYEVQMIAQYQGKYDAIINTVPARVFRENQLRGIMEEDCVLLELASLPGGFPGNGAFAIVDGRGLPGKTAPRTAGKILAETVMGYVRGERRPLE